MKKRFILDSQQAKRVAMAFITMLPVDPAHRIDIKEHADSRTIEQNKKMFAMLQDLADQIDWYGYKLDRYDWKNMITAVLEKQRAVPSLEGNGFVVLGKSTAKMSIKEMSDVIEYAYSIGAEHNVRWKDPKDRAEDPYVDQRKSAVQG